MLFNHAHRDVHTQNILYIQDQCTICKKKKEKKKEKKRKEKKHALTWLILEICVT